MRRRPAGRGTHDRGSTLAESLSGKLGRMLMRVPATVLQQTRLILDNPAVEVAPDVKEFMLPEDPTSIHGLSPHNPLIRSLAEISVDRQVPFHSIIGDRGLGDGPLGSDGVVPYTSAHLEGAASELIVPADHSAHAHPLAVLEVKRILKLHLQQNAATNQ